MSKENFFPKIAIVGMGALVPGARTLGEFWRNILRGQDCIEDVPESFWNHQDYYDSDPFARDKTYCKRGGFLPPVQFDCVEFGIPPNVLESTSLNQLLALKVAKDTLLDAHLLGDAAISYDKSKMGVILGANLGGSAFPLRERITLPSRMQEMLNRYGVDPAIINNVVSDLQDGFIDWNENSFPGFLPNIVSGRIVNRFDFGGPNFTVDAACASSLCAMMQAVHELQTHSCDLVLTGGVNVSNDPLSYLSFSKTPALSLKNRIRPYDKDADGMLVGDGIGMMVLMRLDEAVAAGHRIYAVIAGLGSASDGKAKSIYAPRMEGQLLAISRAYQNSDISPDQISLIEGHGTGTPVGDACEVNGLRHYFADYKLPAHSIALGSVKSQIGHTTQAAGAASAIKVALALHHKVLPPTINVDEPNPDYKLDESPFYISTDATPWFQGESAKRCAAVSSFGFGGINYHLLMEEYQAAEAKHWQRLNPLPQLLLLAAPDPAALREQCLQLLSKLADLSEFDDEAALLQQFNQQDIPEHHSRLGLVATDRDTLANKLHKAVDALNQDKGAQWQLPGGICFRRQALPDSAKLLVMFSGQGAQYPQMGKELALNFPEMHAAFAEIDRELQQQGKTPLSELLFPSGINAAAREAMKSQLKRTEHVQPALAAFCAGAYDILKNLGLHADMMLGHSFGELTALWASGALSRSDFLRLSVARGQAMQASTDEHGDPGAMLAVNQPPGNLADLIAPIGGVRIANLNSPQQAVLSGSSAAITQAEALLSEQKIKVVRLPVSGAFHSTHMQQAAIDFTEALQQTRFSRGEVPVFANLTAQPYRNLKTANSANMRKTLAKHLEEPVLFQQSIEAAYENGARVFVEIGPKAILSSFASATLQGKDVNVLSLNPAADKDPVLQLFELEAQLRVLGKPLAQDPYRLEPQTNNPNTKKVLVTLQGRHYLTPESLERITRANSNAKASDNQQTAVQSSSNSASSPQSAATDNTNHNPGTKTATTTTTTTTTSTTASPAANKATLSSKESTMSEPHKSANHPVPENQASAADNSQAVTGNLSINEILQCQTANSQVQNLFYQTQTQQLQVLDRLMQNQQAVMDKLDSVGATNGSEIARINTEHTQAFDALCRQNQNMFATHDAFLSNQNAILARMLGQNNIALQQADLNVTTRPVLSTPATHSVTPTPTPHVATTSGQAQTSNSAPTTPQAIAAVSDNNTTPAAINSAALPNQDELAAVLLQVVSDSTGYPSDVIDLDMNLEADLGIDSIKRVEIFSNLNDRYPDYGDYVNIADLAELTTLQGIIDYFANLATTIVANVEGSTTQVSPTDGSGAAVSSTAAFVDTGSAPESVDNASPSRVAAATGIASITASPTAATAEDQASTPLSVEDFSQLLLDTISRTTGYPVDVIDVDMDLEADLGVDSIKRVELFAVVQQQYEDLTRDIDPMDLMELKTLQQIVDYFAERFGPDANTGGEETTQICAEPVNNVADINSGDSEKDASVWIEANLSEADLKHQGTNTINSTITNTNTNGKKKAVTSIAARYRVSLESVSVPSFSKSTASEIKLDQHHILITDDGGGNGRRLQQHLKDMGARATLLCFEELAPSDAAANKDRGDDVFNASILSLNDNAISKLLETISAQRGAITGFVHINPLCDSNRSVAEFFDDIETQLLRCVFFIAKHLKPGMLKQPQAFITMVTRIDGKLGFADNLPHSIVQGGYCGLIKSLKMEAPQLNCRSIDIAPDISNDDFISIFMQELSDGENAHLELGRSAVTARAVLKEYQADISSTANSQQPDRDTVFLVSGGGRGVTAQCLERLAQQYQCKFIIIGRTPLDTEEPEWARACKDEDALRQSLLQQTRDAGEKPVPSKLDQTVKKLVTQRELQHTLDSIRDAGGDAIYISEDIANGNALQRKVHDAVKEMGSITGIIHGAGNIADKLLETKQETDFDLVYNSKVRGLSNLLQCVNLDELKYVVLFSSISGFYGQLGQADYSLANEILNKFALLLRHRQALAVLRTINWGPWDGGMVSPSLKNVYAKFDVAVMPIAEGTEFFLDEFRFVEPGAEQVLVCPKNIGKVRSSLSGDDPLNQLDAKVSHRA